jgi:3-oxoacyl-[acyl-carrier protein] reductase
MKARGWGRIVNITSLTVLGTLQRRSYAAANAVLTSFTRSCPADLGSGAR